jgi:hypothetical protein
MPLSHIGVFVLVCTQGSGAWESMQKTVTEVPVFFWLQTILRPSRLFYNILYGVIADTCSILGVLGMSQPGRRLPFFT